MELILVCEDCSWAWHRPEHPKCIVCPACGGAIHAFASCEEVDVKEGD